MPFGLTDEQGFGICVKSVECFADVTEDFGLFKIRQKFCNTSEKVVDASFLFPISDCEIITDFKVMTGNDTVFSHLVKKRDADPLEGLSFTANADRSSFRVHIGKMAPGRTIETELCYIKNTENRGGYCKITIPTLVMPEITENNNQYSFDTVLNYRCSLDFKYYGSEITDVRSGTHKLKFEKSGNRVTAVFDEVMQGAEDFVIEIRRSLSQSTAVYRSNNVIYCTFRPQFDIYNRRGRKYLFMINAGERHRTDIKTAVLVCLRAMAPDDLFNIIMVSRKNSVFADDFIKADDNAMRAAAEWFDSPELGDSVELFSAVISSYRHSGNTSALLITDEKMSQNEDIMAYISNHRNNTYYLFEINNTGDRMFLKALAEETGGKYCNITAPKRTDIEIIKAFNIIAAPCITDAEVSFDGPVNNTEITGTGKIHCGDKVGVVAECYDRIPEHMYIDGMISGEKISFCTELSNILPGGTSLRFLLAKNLIDSLSRSLSSCSISEERKITEKITEISAKYNLYNKYMDMLLMNCDGGLYDCVSIIRPKALPFDWYLSAMKSYSAPQNPGDAEFISLIKRQHAGGYFNDSAHRTKEGTVSRTAGIIIKICSEYAAPQLFIWQLRKAVEFLMKSINDSESAKIPNDVLKALKIWHEKFGGTDEISQKAGTLANMYGNFI